MPKRTAPQVEVSFDAPAFVLGQDGICHGTSPKGAPEEPPKSPPVIDLSAEQPDEEMPDAEMPDAHEPAEPAPAPMDATPTPPPAQPETPMKDRRVHSPVSTAASTPVITPTSPEARAHARNSEVGKLPVKELKARLQALGANITGLAEKAELVALLETLQAQANGDPPPFAL